MRSQVFALLASSLLVKDAMSMPFSFFSKQDKRDLYLVQENIIVTKLATVTAAPDGSFATGEAVVVGTATSRADPVLVSDSVLPTVAPAPSTEAAPTAAPETEAPVPSTSAEVESTVEAAAPTLSVPAVATPEPMKTTSAAPEEPKTTEESKPTEEPKTTTTAAPAAETSPTAPASDNTANKRGLAFNYESPPLTNFLKGNSKISWSYNWGMNAVASPSSVAPASLEYIPMLWGLDPKYTGAWSKAATAAIAAGAKHLLGFNEPDLGAQANISPSDAAAGWKQFMQPFAGKALLGSPAVTNGGAPMGLGWIKSFLADCADCQVDFVCIHWYNGGDADAFKKYVQQAYDAGGKRPVWITEFEAPGNSDAEQQAFLDEVMPFLDSSSMVDRYAYFGAFEGKLLSSGSGALSAVGNTFAFGS